MQTDCIPDLFGFVAVEGRPVVAAFDGGSITSDAGAMLLGATDRAIGLIDRFAACFRDFRCPELIEHEVETLIGQRVFGLALGYEDLIDHDQLRHDPVMAILAGKLEARREDCAPVAGKSTLNRLELSRPEPTRYHKISHDGAMIERLLVDLFLEAHRSPPKQIILDLDATDDPLHGHQEGRFFHGYYDGYCYLPLYVFCGRHLLAAKLRKADIDASAGAVEEIARIVAQLRASWPDARILLRADSGFAREALMAWCEANRVDYLFGLARNPRLAAMIESELAAAKSAAEASGKPARRFKEFRWSTLDSWSRERRVVAKAEWTQGEANPRFVVTSLSLRRPTRAASTRRSIARAATWRTGSRNARPICSPTAPRRRPCAPISCGCGSPPSPTFSSAPCAASASSARSSPRPIAPPSVSSCSRSARSCGSRSAASSSPWPHPSPISANTGSRTPGSPPRPADEPDSAQSSYQQLGAAKPKRLPLFAQNTRQKTVLPSGPRQNAVARQRTGLTD